MPPFLDQLRDGVTRCGLAGGRVLLAVSGGADSVAMARGLMALRNECDLTLAVAHFDHQLRGEASAADARWLVAQCAAWGLDCHVGSADVRQAAAAAGTGLEEAARAARYEFLAATARHAGFPLVALAHTADDQAETILHHVVRGTGLAGLAGIPERRPLAEGIDVVRPLREIGRDTLLAFLAEIGQEFRHDESNRDMAHTRNRLRHDLLPRLRRDFNPRVDEALRRLGWQAAEVHEALAVLARRLLDAVLVERSATICRLDGTPLADQPRALVRECLRQLWERQKWPRQRMGYDHWDHLADIALAGGAATLPSGITARRDGSLLILRRRISR